MNAEVKKGDVLGVARVAGVMAAKRTAELIPLCHPLTLDDVQVVAHAGRVAPRHPRGGVGDDDRAHRSGDGGAYIRRRSRS